MGTVSTLRGILKSTTEGPAWHGPATLEVLKDISPEKAVARPIENAHTIWELLLHMNAWQRYTLRALYSEEVGDPQDMAEDENWPAIETETQEAWDRSVLDFQTVNVGIRSLLDGMSDDSLEETVPGRDFAMKVLVHGVAQHNLYHAGQISLLKKAAL